MLAALEAGDVGHSIALATLVAARVAPIVLLVPWLGQRTPSSIRVAIVAALTCALLPVATADGADLATVTANTAAIGTALVRQITIGVTIGLAASLAFHGLEMGGRLIDTARGSSLGDSASALGGDPTTPLGNLFVVAAIALFVALGGPAMAIAAIGSSFIHLPLGAPIIAGDVPRDAVVRVFVENIALGVAIATPAFAAALVADAVLGAIGKAAPQIPLFFAGMPVRAAVGIGATLVALAWTWDSLPGALRASVDAMNSLVDTLRAT